MKKLEYKFSLADLEKLYNELNGRVDENGVTIEVGLLDSLINLKLKFLFTQINNSMCSYRTKWIEFRDKLIYKLGTKNLQGIPEITMFIFEQSGNEQVQVTNPVYDQYQKDLGKYMSKEVRLLSYPLDLNELKSIERTERFPMLMSYLEQQLFEEEKVS